MKNKFLYLLILMFLFIPFSASALSLSDGTEVTLENIRYYFDEQVYFASEDFYSNYKYCLQSNPGYGTNNEFACFDEENKEKIINFYKQGETYNLQSNNLIYKLVDISKNDYSITIAQPMNTLGNPYMNIVFWNFDIETSYGTVFEANWNSIIEPSVFEVKFDIPENVDLTIKKSDGEEIVYSGDNIYTLEKGSYIYIIESEMYQKLEVEFVVSENVTIKPELISKLDLNSYSSLFNNFYLVLGSIAGKIFILENPLFLILIATTIIIAIVLLLKKILGGK